MAAAIADYDRDGFPDILVTNDKMPNFLFHNLQNGRFEEVAFQAGVALLDSGSEISNMGGDFRDLNNDGLPDIAATALSGETFPLFLNQGRGHFGDAGYASHLGRLSRIYSGWGIGMFDFNNDGWKDIFAANSHVNDRVEAFEATEYKQHNSIFLNDGNGTFLDVSDGAGESFSLKRAHRGCAFADFNNDGRIDVVVSALGQPAELWENISPSENTWLTLRLTGTKSNRDGIGAEISIGNQYNHMTTAVGYASSSHSGVHFGAGKQRQIDRIEIRWPSGTRQELRNVRTNQILDVREANPKSEPPHVSAGCAVTRTRWRAAALCPGNYTRASPADIRAQARRSPPAAHSVPFVRETLGIAGNRQAPVSPGRPRR
jgi:hypothetical protein